MPEDELVDELEVEEPRGDELGAPFIVEEDGLEDDQEGGEGEKSYELARKDWGGALRDF